MPVGLTLFIAIFGTIVFFGALFGFIVLAISGRRAVAKPKLGMAPGEKPGTLSVWVNWDPSQFALQVYRLRFSFAAPESKTKEGTFTVTFDSPQETPFIQSVELPAPFKDILGSSQEKGLFSVDFRTADEMSMSISKTFTKVRKILAGEGKAPAIANKLATAVQDVATVFTLDFEELQIHKKRIRELEAAAKAKAAKAAATAAAAAAKPVAAPAATTAAASAPAAAPIAKPAAAPIPSAAKPVAAPATPAPAAAKPAVAPATPAPAAVKPAAAPTPAPDPVKETPAATAKAPAATPPADKPLKSVREVVSASNTKEKPGADKP